MPSQPSAVLPGRGHGLILFFSKDTPPTPIYTLSLHDALPIFLPLNTTNSDGHELVLSVNSYDHVEVDKEEGSEEHTSESSHTVISYAVFCLKKKNTMQARWSPTRPSTQQ